MSAESKTEEHFFIEELSVRQIPLGDAACSASTLLAYCVAGSVWVDVDTEKYLLRSGDGLFVFPQKTLRFSQPSDDFRMARFVFCRDILDRVVAGLPASLILYIRMHPCVSLDRNDRLFIGTMAEQVRRVGSDREQAYKDEIVANILRNFLLIHYGSASVERTEEPPYKRSEDLFKRFITDIEIYCAQDHNVVEYADRLCITPKYLTCIARKKTGKSPKELIDQAVLRRAQAGLRNTAKSVKQIGADCGFPNPGYFARFFKRMTGRTPQQFRENK